MLTIAFLLAIGVNTDFEAGNLEKFEQVSENHLRFLVRGEVDQDKRNRQPSWFYFRLDGAAGRDLTIDITNLAGEYNYRKHDGSGLRDMHPVYSYDDRNWRNFPQAEWIGETSTVRIRFKPERDRLWIARIAPYTTTHLNRLLGELCGRPHFKEEIIGRTVEGRPMLLLTLTNPKIAGSRKKSIWIMARQHSWESGTSWAAEGALRFLTSGDPAAAKLRDECVFKIFPMCDPDGVARGGVRYNKHGYDLNRNWDAVDPKLMPEIASQRKAVLDWVDSGKPVHLFVTLHNTERSDFIEGPLSAGGPEMKALGERFWKLLVETSTFYSPGGPRNSPASTTAGMKGRMSVNQGLFHDRKIPAFLMELMVDANPKLSRQPTVQDRLEFGAALARAMAAAVGAATVRERPATQDESRARRCGERGAAAPCTPAPART